MEEPELEENIVLSYDKLKKKITYLKAWLKSLRSTKEY